MKKVFSCLIALSMILSFGDIAISADRFLVIDLATGQKKTVTSISGFDINDTNLTSGDAVIDAASEKIVLGTGNDIIALDAADAVYRLVIGHAAYLATAKGWYRGDYLIGIGKGAGGGAGSAAKGSTNGHCTGGTGGTGGGWIYIEARDVTVSATGVITANGSAGSNGSAVGGDSILGPAAGGGGGGGGGALVIRYSAYSNSGSVTASGGAGGTGNWTPDHAGAGAGGTGGAGTLWTINV